MSRSGVPNPEHSPEANIDPLTGLPNRRWFDAELARMTEQHELNGRGFGLVFVDVDGLKLTNDTLGHEVGDKLIINTGDTLKENLRSGKDDRDPDQMGHAVFRLAGDEFVIILAGTTEQTQVDAAVGHLQRSLEAVGISASMGGRPHRKGESGSELLKAVDERMYEEKRGRKLKQAEDAKAQALIDYNIARSGLGRWKRLQHDAGKKLLKMSGLAPPTQE